jgi:hypothetical protein
VFCEEPKRRRASPGSIAAHITWPHGIRCRSTVRMRMELEATENVLPDSCATGLPGCRRCRRRIPDTARRKGAVSDCCSVDRPARADASGFPGKNTHPGGGGCFWGGYLGGGGGRSRPSPQALTDPGGQACPDTVTRC